MHVYTDTINSFFDVINIPLNEATFLSSETLKFNFSYMLYPLFRPFLALSVVPNSHKITSSA